MNTKVFRNLSYGVYITTSLDGDKPVGCVTNSVMQITSNPATIAVSVNHDNYTNSCIMKTKKFAVSILSEESDPTIIGTFGFKSSKEVDKFKQIKYRCIDNLPIISDNCGYLVCDVINTLETDTHTVFLGRVIGCDNYKDIPPMTYSYYHKVLKGSSPKKAPTYIEEIVEKEDNTKKTKYKCSLCGYIHEVDGELDDNYICPICGQPKKAFYKLEETSVK